MSNILKGLQLTELSTNKLAQYKTAAASDAKKADSEGDYKRGDKRFSGIVKATKKQFANDEKQLKEFAADDGEGGEEDILRKYAKLWYNGDLGTQQQVEKILDRMGWEIGELESEEGGAFVVQPDDENGDSYIGFTAADLTGEVDEAYNNYHANRTGFSRGPRDDERHDLDTPTQVWGLKINGKVWSKGGKDVTFTSKQAALNARNSILKTKPELEIGLVTKGGVAEDLDENLHKWFKEKWVRFGPDGKIRGACARGDDSEGKPKCLPQSKAHSLGKKGRASAAARKRREDPNPERHGKAINVNTKKKSNESVVLGRDEGNFAGDTPVNLGGAIVKNLGIGDIVSYLGQKAKILAMSKTGNTSRIHIPSGMGGVTKDVLTKDLKRTSLSEEELDEACWKGYHKEGNKKMFGKTYPNCVKNEGVAEDSEHYDGIEISMEKEDDEIMVKAMMSGGRELGHVLFVIDGEYLAPQDLEVDERYQGQGIAATMYDYVKSKGYKIRRSGQQTDAGAGFWDKHRPEQNVWEEHHAETCPHCGGEMVSEELMNEKKDACYYKVKSRYKVWPSAYASGALVKCRKKGASNWGTGGKSNESVAEGSGLDNYRQRVNSQGFTDSPEEREADRSERKRRHQDALNRISDIGGGSSDEERAHQAQQRMARDEYKLDRLKRNDDDWENTFDMMRDRMNRYQWSSQRDVDPEQLAAISNIKYEPKQKNETVQAKTDDKLLAYYAQRKAEKEKQQNQPQDQLDEKWSQKYKDSINCSNPKGFSQKAHCAGKNKNESAIMKGLK